MMLKKLVKTYFIGTSILAHCVIFVMAVYFLSERVTNHWRWPIIKRWVLGDVDKTDVYPLGLNDFKSLPKGRRAKIHQQRSADRVRFVRQVHAGSGFDQITNRLLLFGSDTHGKDWNNTAYSFELNTSLWTDSYSFETYKVNVDGFSVAGSPLGDAYI